MKKTIDLHIHSNFSEDGDLSVEDIFKLADKLSISAISITDHDSIESIDIARNCLKDYSIEYIPGVEITTVFQVDGSQQHLLGYFINDKSPALIETLNRIKELRVITAKRRIDKFKEIGFSLDENRIWEITGKRAPTAISIMIEILKNEKNSNDKRLYDYIYGNKKEDKLKHFYRDYLTQNKPAYVPFQSIQTKEGVDIIQRAEGIPVLAHPKFVKKKEWLDIIRNYGIQGIEAFSSYHNKEDIRFYLEYSERYNLIITAGSDFHGPTAKPKVKLGGIEGNYYIYLQKLKDFYLSKK